jgi:hypothetical protein
MEANYNYYKIDVADIWQYERSIFLNDNSSSKLAKKIIDKAEPIIIKDGNPSFGINYRDSQDENERMYYERNYKIYAEASKSLKERYEINFFFNKYSCFQYDQSIVVNRDYIDFDFWFAIKLRQFESKLSEIKNFLNFQLEANFNNSIIELAEFLKISIRQYQSKFLKKRVVETLKDWIENKLKRISDAGQKGLLKDIHLDDKLILRINYDQVDLFEAIKAFFDEKDHEKLTSLLNEEEIDDKICFKSNANQFVMIFRQLHLNQKIIGTLAKTEDWICAYFTYIGPKNKQTTFSNAYVHRTLTRTSFTIPKSNRINLPGLDYIIDKKK